MIEIIVVVYLSQRLASVARENGRPGSWGALFAAGWIGGEILGALAGVLALGAESFGAYLVALVGAIIGGTLAWFVVSGLSPTAGAAGPGYAAVGEFVPPGPVVPEPPRPTRRAGFCMECSTNVWLTSTGACPNGHGPQSLTKCYTVEQ